MEHRRPDGTLAEGYYCSRCGAPGVNMFATGHGIGKCEANPKLVSSLIEVNRAWRTAAPSKDMMYAKRDEAYAQWQSDNATRAFACVTDMLISAFNAGWEERKRAEYEAMMEKRP